MKNHSTKVAFVVSGIRKSLQFEWTARELRKQGIEQYYILFGEKNTPLAACLRGLQIPVFEFRLFRRAGILICFLNVFFLLLRIRPHVVHTHMQEANFFGLLAARLLFIKKRIYTRHHSTFHHDYHSNAVKRDRFINDLSTTIIAPSMKTAEVLINRERVEKAKIQCIPHGFDLQYFADVEEVRVELLRSRYGISKQERLIIGCIARYTHFKGVQILIPAFRKFLQKFPDARLLLANARGDFQTEIRQLLQTLPAGSFREIEFEDDAAALYRLFTINVNLHVDPYAEAFGQTFVEALASGVPSVFTLSGVGCEFIVDRENALVATYHDAESAFLQMSELAVDGDLQRRIIAGGRRSVAQFDIALMTERLYALYRS